MSHYFTINEFELVRAMFKDNYTINCNSLGPFGEKTGKVISFDKDDAEFDCDFLRATYEDEIEKFSDDKKAEFEDYTAVYYSDASEMFPTIDNDYEMDKIVVFDKEIGQCFQNFFQWDRCIGDLYCDEDDYNEFIKEHEEFQTTEWHIAQMKHYLTEHHISVETFQKNLQVAQTKTYFFIDVVNYRDDSICQVGHVKTSHDEILQEFAKVMQSRSITDWDGLRGVYEDSDNSETYVVRELKVPLS